MARVRNLLASVFVSALASCATIVAPKSSMVAIDSVPQGAKVVYRSANVGVTPCTIKVDVSTPRLQIVQDGYHEQWVDVGTTTSGWIIGNLVFGGIPGLLIDALGGGNIVDDKPCWIEMTPVAEGLPAVWERPRPTLVQTSEWEPQQVAPAEVSKPAPTKAPALEKGKAPPSGWDKPSTANSW